MKVMHRCNSESRQHFLLEQYYSFQLKPRLLYVGYLDKESGWAEEKHSHDFLEIVFVADGTGKVFVNNNIHEIHKGDVLIYNAGVSHFEQGYPNNPMELLFVAYDKLKISGLQPNCLLPESYGCLFHGMDMYKTLRDCFDQLVHEFEANDRFYREIVQSISQTLVMYVLRLINCSKDTSALLDSSLIVGAARAYMDEHFREKVTLDDLAQICFTNKYYISHLFTRMQGISIGKYLLHKRIEKAKYLLSETTLSAEAIAEQIGFRDPAYFCRVFRKETGKPPAEWRRAKRNETVPLSE